MLYKFHQVNHFLYQLILDSKLWFSNPSEFNDPFDMKFISSLETSEQERTDSVDQILNKLYTDDFRFDKALAKEALLKRALESNVTKMFNESIVHGFQQFGVCCFSEKIDELLLWSHYTNGHRGVCLEFDFSNENQIKGWLKKVQYSNDFPLVKVHDDIFKAITTKSLCWKYENEHRLITPTKGSFSFSKTSLKGIVFGAKTEEIEINRIMKLIKQTGYENIEFKKASIGTDKYEIIVSLLPKQFG